MLRTFAVALLAASVLAAPVFAQGSGAATTPPVKTETNATSAMPKVVTAKPTLKTAKVKPSKRYAHRHVKHVRHVAYAKPVKHVAYVKPVRHVAYVKPIRHVAHVKRVAYVKPVRHVAHVKHVAYVKPIKRVAHVRHVAHVKQVKHIKHVKVAHAVRSTKPHTHVRHVANKTIGQNGATPAPKAKSNVN